MKILIVTPRIPYPPYRGDKLKIFNICQNLITHNYVKVLTFLSKSSERSDVAELINLGIDIETVSLPKVNSLMNLFRSIFTLNPLQISYYYARKMHKRIYQLTLEKKFDVVYFHLLNSAQYYNAVASAQTLKVLDFTDATSLFLIKFLKFIKNPFKKIIFCYELWAVSKYEKIARQFDTLFVCSHVDREFLSDRKVHNNIQLLLNGYDHCTFKYEEKEAENGRIIFTGNMTYFPNIDAVTYFAKEIFPLVLEKIPYAKFYIVGQAPPKQVLKLMSDNVIVTGFAKDLKQEYLKSRISVAPIRFGSGSLNKIIESMVLGIPIVATNFAIQGFPKELTKYIFTADNELVFANKVVEIMNGDQSIMMKEAAEKISELLSWDNIVRNFEVILKEQIAIKEKSN